ncbi:hypothetical protein J6590_091593 [Homalodisca vitripennis]|nr:hypothetical protein J6590_091593 [Homalodisca vitripennis]
MTSQTLTTRPSYVQTCSSARLVGQHLREGGVNISGQGLVAVNLMTDVVCKKEQCLNITSYEWE